MRKRPRLGNTIARVKAVTICETMIDVQAEALFLAVTGDTPNDVETKALVVRLSGMLAEEKAEIVLNTLATWTRRH